jgi:hypothetical protein
MARTDQGNDLLTLIPSSDARFVTTKGGFDTGSRAFTCDTSVADRLEPRTGSKDLVHRRMYVDSVERVDGVNQVTTFSVSYLGIKNGNRKGRYIEESAATEWVSNTLSGLGAIGGAISMRGVPTVTVTYVGSVKPSLEEIGANLIPPGGYPKKYKLRNYMARNLTVNVAFEGWVLKNRQNRPVGAAVLWETVDTYTYEVVTFELS